LSRPGISFRRRLALQLLALMVPWSLFVFTCLVLVFHREAEGFQRERDQQTSLTLADEMATLFHNGRISHLGDLVDEHKEAWPALRYIFLQEPSGSLLWSSFEEGTPATLVHLRAEEPKTGDPAPLRVTLGHEHIDDFLQRRSGLLVRLGFDATPARTVALRMVPVILVTGIAGLALVFGLASFLSRPVEALDRAVKRAVDLDEATRRINPDETVSETASIAAHFDELMDRLEVRTRQLDSARKLAYLGEISTSIAHDVNNPLGVVVLNTSFLKRRLEAGQLPEACEGEVRRAWRAARRATLVVQKFLQFSRYSGEKGRLLHRPVDLRALAEEAVELLEDKLHGSPVTVRVDAPDELDPVLCDEQGVLQVLLNLASNAVDATSEGCEVVIEVRVEPDRVLLRVTDCGTGMSPEVLARVSEPFYTTKEEGTGLGVSISRSIVESHGGELTYESRAGEGTTATVKLPLHGGDA
jgi:signal transduction histidine kinase